LKLDGVYDPSWASVVWPLVLPGMQLTFGNFILGTLVYAYGSTGFDASDVERWKMCSPLIFDFILMWPARSETAPFATLLNLPAGVALLLLMAKIAYYIGNPGYPYLVCAAPIAVQTVLLSVGVLSKKLIRESYEVDFVFFSIILLLWGIAMLLVAAKADGLISMNWYRVFIPLLIINCLWFLGIMIAPIASICCKEWMRSHATWRTRYGSAWEKCLLAIPLSVTLVTPLIVFEVLLVLNLEHARFDTYGVILAPIYCSFGLLTAMWLAVRFYDVCKR